LSSFSRTIGTFNPTNSYSRSRGRSETANNLIQKNLMIPSLQFPSPGRTCPMLRGSAAGLGDSGTGGAPAGTAPAQCEPRREHGFGRHRGKPGNGASQRRCEGLALAWKARAGCPGWRRVPCPRLFPGSENSSSQSAPSPFIRLQRKLGVKAATPLSLIYVAARLWLSCGE